MQPGVSSERWLIKQKFSLSLHVTVDEKNSVLFFMQIQSEDLAQSLGLKTGQYMVKQLPHTTQSSQLRQKKGRQKSRISTPSAVKLGNCSANAEEAGNWTMGDSVMQMNSFEELIDTQKLFEFAISSANPKDIVDFEPTQVLQSDYMEGPVIKIEEFPGSVPEIPGGTSTSAEEDMLLCCMAQSSTSDLAAASDSTEQNFSFKQSLMVTSAPMTQSSTLSFPLTLTVDGAALDNCPALQFS